jgi:hypothetical protein
MRMIKPNKFGWAVYVGRIGEIRNAYKMLAPKRNMPLEGHRPRWEDNFTMD